MKERRWFEAATEVVSGNVDYFTASMHSTNEISGPFLDAHGTVSLVLVVGIHTGHLGPQCIATRLLHRPNILSAGFVAPTKPAERMFGLWSSLEANKPHISIE